MTQRHLTPRSRDHPVLQLCYLFLVLLLLAAGAQAAEHRPSADLLLPCFEVELDGSVTTLFAVVNSGQEAVPVRIAAFSNWGIEVFATEVVLEPDEVRTVNLADWILHGQLPDRTLTVEEIEHNQHALCGLAAPDNGLYYSTTAVEDPEMAVGSIEITALGFPQPQVLWGDFFIVDPSRDYAQGDVLVNVDAQAACAELCVHHAVRFLNGGGFDGGTQLMIWNPKTAIPSPDPEFPADERMWAQIAVYDEAGLHVEDRYLSFLPMDMLRVADLGLTEPFGWLEIITETDSFVTVVYSADNRFSVALVSHCLPLELGGSGGKIRIEKMTNGIEAPVAPGPRIPVGNPVEWTYVVMNTGNVTLNDVEVSDDQGVEVTCPYDVLEPGQDMTCRATGTATACQYRNVGQAVGITSSGERASDYDASHYFGEERAAIEIEKATNGYDADQPPGPTVGLGEPVTWTYVVTNTGAVPVNGIAVSDDQGVIVACPADTLAPGASMTCTAAGEAVRGQYRNVGTVTAATPCGEEIGAEDPSHYKGSCVGKPAIAIEKATNGIDADVPPGPTLGIGATITWTYLVTNTGTVTLHHVSVVDDQGVVVACPKDKLSVGESMTCTATGMATAGPYRNLGMVSAHTACGAEVAARDPSHYQGRCVEEPGIAIEKATNGHDADTPPGPVLEIGDSVEWTYTVTNVGDVALHSVVVRDDKGVAISCPSDMLAAGGSMICTAYGVAASGPYRNLGLASAITECGTQVAAEDPSHYEGVEEGGDEGCTPGYWKNHHDSWPPTGYVPSQPVVSVFAQASAYPALGAATLAAALDFGGGGGLEGAAKILLRAAVAALLNASHPGVDYPWTASEVISAVNSALASNDRDTMLSLATTLDQANNLGCPLS